MTVDHRRNSASASIEIENNSVESCFNAGLKNVRGSASGTLSIQFWGSSIQSLIKLLITYVLFFTVGVNSLT